jgi:hypothetical protein
MAKIQIKNVHDGLSKIAKNVVIKIKLIYVIILIQIFNGAHRTFNKFHIYIVFYTSQI